MQHIKSLLFPLLLLFWLFCLPLAFVIYSPVLYQANCHWNERCEQLGEQGLPQRIAELNQFFRHQHEVLPKPWTDKENRHLAEVRAIYDVVFLLFAVLTVVFMADYCLQRNARRYYADYARNAFFISLGLLLLTLLIVPHFNSFWIKVFHPLLFDNDLWHTNSQDVSWYLMPKVFFLRVTVFIGVCAVGLNSLAWWILDLYNKPLVFNRGQ